MKALLYIPLILISLTPCFASAITCQNILNSNTSAKLFKPGEALTVEVFASATLAAAISQNKSFVPKNLNSLGDDEALVFVDALVSEMFLISSRRQALEVDDFYPDISRNIHDILEVSVTSDNAINTLVTDFLYENIDSIIQNAQAMKTRRVFKKLLLGTSLGTITASGAATALAALPNLIFENTSYGFTVSTLSDFDLNSTTVVTDASANPNTAIWMIGAGAVTYIAASIIEYIKSGAQRPVYDYSLSENVMSSEARDAFTDPEAPEPVRSATPKLRATTASPQNSAPLGGVDRTPPQNITPLGGASREAPPTPQNLPSFSAN